MKLPAFGPMLAKKGFLIVNCSLFLVYVIIFTGNEINPKAFVRQEHRVGSGLSCVDGGRRRPPENLHSSSGSSYQKYTEKTS